MKNQNKEEINLYRYEEELYDNGYKNVCGIDEAGRGPLAGPVVVAACIMPPFLRIDGINDSKQLSEKKREELYKIIVKEALAYSVVFINEKDIDNLNILNATKKGMLKCLEDIKVKPDYVLIDAVELTELKVESKAIIHGDALSASIAAASILAKVTRDHYMEAMDKKYPN
ncbi:MAG: ribonuclease HII, partial [Acholeplasmatales bacterium]|nr:ribonuclease HII [Acholeplasmatales bacterium]